MKIKIMIKDDVVLTAKLNKSRTSEEIASTLPLEGSANVWGDEIYFEIPVDIPLSADAVEEVEIGTLAYWPTGSALCIFFGPTPVSTGSKPRAYSPVNVFGIIEDIEENTAVLKSVPNGAQITIMPDN